MSALGGIASIIQSVVGVSTTAIGTQAEYKQQVAGQEQEKVNYYRSQDLFSYSSYSFEQKMVALVVAAAIIAFITVMAFKKAQR